MVNSLLREAIVGSSFSHGRREPIDYRSRLRTGSLSVKRGGR